MNSFYNMAVLAFIGFLSQNTYAIDVKINNNPLVGTEVMTPDYTLVIEGKNPSISKSKTVKKHNARLTTLSARTSTSGFPTKGLRVVDILPPKTKLVVKEVWHDKPSFPDYFFTEGHHFAVLEHNQKKYTVAPISNRQSKSEIYFELNDCKKNRLCKGWRDTIQACMKNKKGYCYVYYNLYIKDENSRIVWDKNIRPPYKKTWINSTLNPFKKYIKMHELDVVIDSNHLAIRAKVTPLELANTFLDYQNLNIQNVSLLSLAKGTSWGDLKK